MTPLRMWADNTRPHNPGGQRTPRNMVPDPPKSDIHPLSSLQGIRTVKILVLTTTIHDQEVTMVQPGRAGITVQTEPRCPFEKRRDAETHRHNEFGLLLLPKKTLIVAVPPDART